MTWQAYTRSDDARRTGSIELLDGSDFTIRFNAVGVWSISADWSDDLWDRLEPGGGIVLRRDDHYVCSGPITGYGFEVSDSDDGGEVATIVVEGVTDEIVLADRIVYPDPTLLGTNQTSVSHWRMTGPAEDVMCALVDQQAGPVAHHLRRTVGLTVAPSQGRGPVVNEAIRYGAPNLLAELQRIAIKSGLGFRVVPAADGGRRFEVYEPSNKAGRIRYGTEMGNVAGQSYRSGAPTLTDSLVGGGGEGTARIQRAASRPDDDETWDWNRRIETYVDARDTTELADLDERASDAVEDTGPKQSYSFTPIDTDNARLFADVNLGDKVTVYAGPPGGRRVSRFVDVVREIHGELGADDETLRAAVGSEGATTGVPSMTAEMLLKIRADLQALKGSA